MRIRLPSRTDQLGSLREELRRFLPGLRLSPEAVQDLVLAVHEAVINAMTHGNQLDPGKSVRVLIEARVDDVSIEVADEGPGFDWRAWEARLAREGVPPDRPRGRGLLVISRLMDGVAHNPVGNVIRLTKRCDRRSE